MKREYTSALDTEQMKKVREEIERDSKKILEEIRREVDVMNVEKYNILPDWL